MEFAFAFIFGIVIGMLAVAIGMLRLHVGTLRIDMTDPQKDIYRLDLDDFDSISKREFIMLRVDTHADLSQK